MDVSAVGGFSVEFVATPTISTLAYSIGDQVGGLIELFTKDNGGRVRVGACQAEDCVSTLMSLVIHDKASQSAEFVVFFFNALPTVASVDNGALTITDAQMAEKCVGTVAVTAAQYQTVASSSIASVKMSDAALSMLSKVDNGPLWAVVKTTGTPTYASASDLTLRFLFSQDTSTT